VALGEALIHDVYTALRNGPAWASTLLIITYDEAGGCYDHVPPPNAVPPGDGTVGELGFDFKRFGVRVPAVLVSPLIAAGTVSRGAGPIDHTSVLKTIQERWGTASLTARDAAAASLADVLTLAQPRTDDPLAGVAPPAAVAAPVDTRPSAMERIHAERVAALPIKNEFGIYEEAFPILNTSADVTRFINNRMAAWDAQLERQRGQTQG
jgi:phospholipase C